MDPNATVDGNDDRVYQLWNIGQAHKNDITEASFLSII